MTPTSWHLHCHLHLHKFCKWNTNIGCGQHNLKIKKCFLRLHFFYLISFNFRKFLKVWFFEMNAICQGIYFPKVLHIKSLNCIFLKTLIREIRILAESVILLFANRNLSIKFCSNLNVMCHSVCLWQKIIKIHAIYFLNSDQRSSFLFAQFKKIIRQVVIWLRQCNQLPNNRP